MLCKKFPAVLLCGKFPRAVLNYFQREAFYTKRAVFKVGSGSVFLCDFFVGGGPFGEREGVLFGGRGVL